MKFRASAERLRLSDPAKVVEAHFNADVARSVGGAFGRNPLKNWRRSWDLIEEAEWCAYWAAVGAFNAAHPCCSECGDRDRHLTAEERDERQSIEDRLTPSTELNWRRISRQHRLDF